MYSSWSCVSSTHGKIKPNELRQAHVCLYVRNSCRIRLKSSAAMSESLVIYLFVFKKIVGTFLKFILFAFFYRIIICWALTAHVPLELCERPHKEKTYLSPSRANMKTVLQFKRAWPTTLALKKLTTYRKLINSTLWSLKCPFFSLINSFIRTLKLNSLILNAAGFMTVICKYLLYHLVNLIGKCRTMWNIKHYNITVPWFLVFIVSSWNTQLFSHIYSFSSKLCCEWYKKFSKVSVYDIFMLNQNTTNRVTQKSS